MRDPAAAESATRRENRTRAIPAMSEEQHNGLVNWSRPLGIRRPGLREEVMMARVISRTKKCTLETLRTPS